MTEHGYMNAMVLEKIHQPLVLKRLPVPSPAASEVLVKVIACGVCRTDLHITDGELSLPVLPLIPGHEIIGRVVGVGAGVTQWKTGEHVGIPWLAYTCGRCRYCREGRENLCEEALFTGYTVHGGYAEYAVAHADYCVSLSGSSSNASAAPLLCAGLIGYRAYSMIPPTAITVGFYGFGASAHILVQLATQQGKQVFAFTRPGDLASQQLALQLGASWTGDSLQSAPALLDAAIIFAPDGSLVCTALAATAKGGMVICAGIHMTPIPSFPYSLLWGERQIRSVANLTRADAVDFMKIASIHPLHTQVTCFTLAEANTALQQLRQGQITGAAVLVM